MFLVTAANKWYMYPCPLEWPRHRYRKDMSFKSWLALMLPKPWVFIAEMVEGLCLSLRSPPVQTCTQDKPCKSGCANREERQPLGLSERTLEQNWRHQQQGRSLFWNRMSVKDPFSFDLLYEEMSETGKSQEYARGMWHHPSYFQLSIQFKNNLHFKEEDISQVKKKS